MIPGKIKSISSLITGIILTLTGAFFIALYVLEAFIARIGEADQSLLFWYLPFLLLGLGVFGVGLYLTYSGLKQRKRPKQLG